MHLGADRGQIIHGSQLSILFENFQFCKTYNKSNMMTLKDVIIALMLRSKQTNLQIQRVSLQSCPPVSLQCYLYLSQSDFVHTWCLWWCTQAALKHVAVEIMHMQMCTYRHTVNHCQVWSTQSKLPCLVGVSIVVQHTMHLTTSARLFVFVIPL